MRLPAATALLSLVLAGCLVEGEDASLFNNVNELIVVGQNTRGFSFDHYTALMIVELHPRPSFSGVPAERLHLTWVDYDEHHRPLPVDETSEHFFNPVEPGDYYAFAYVDTNGNAHLDRGEPYDVWTHGDGALKPVRVREESRWKLTFRFERTYRGR